MGTEQTSCCHVKSNTLISKQFENLCGYEKSWNWIPLPEDKDGLEKISGFANWLVNWHLRSILKKKECQEKLSHLRNSDRKKKTLIFQEQKEYNWRKDCIQLSFFLTQTSVISKICFLVFVFNKAKDRFPSLL